MTIDARTPQERAYDDLKSGAAYVKPSASDQVWEAIDALIEDEPEIDAYITACLAHERAHPVHVVMSPYEPPFTGAMTFLVQRFGMAGARERIARARATRQEEELDELRAQIDTETDPDMRKRLICRLADWVLGTADEESDPELPPEVASGEMSMLRYLARWIDQHLAVEREAGPPAIRIVQDWEQDGNLNRDGIGNLAFVGYVCGEGDDSAEVVFHPDGKYPPFVYLFGHDDVDLERALRTIANLQTLLSDPRVQALREAQRG